MLQQTFCFGSLNTIPLNGTLYPAKKPKAALLYFHGGGLFYGHRDDLPQAYKKKFLAAGFSLLTFDYPFAPEVSLAQIIACTEQAMTWFQKKGWQFSNLPSPNYFLFGRSAGGYLVNLLTARMKTPLQLGTICFYGYDNLLHPSFAAPSAYYNRFPIVLPTAAKQLQQDTILTTATINERFSMYLSARQFGNWASYLGKRGEIKLFCLTKQDLVHFPPVFIVHCTNDPDVPVSIAKDFAATLPQATLTLLPLSEHDFDRIPTSTADNIYQQTIEWAEKVMTTALCSES